MTKEQEKAKELVNDKYYQPITIYLNVNNNSKEMWEYAKRCALIAVDLVISEYESLNNHTGWDWDAYLTFWDNVKEEIKKI